ncbi:MAG TPA: hypothetical protein VJT49_28915 [Amycolatopsis sp.]|uniref:effector-associated domain 2-containing protein n=1 Tax=Amycolatopsis sp. TaxID=37632 RepID=UPI002B482E72|nr:hypothetical protein [Amycolatopsis sp.]HKS49059.1 hypothetical protein [Amycolatopsis sp.]
MSEKLPESAYRFRTIMVVDVARFTDPARTEHHQRTVQESLYDILRVSFDDSGVHWKQCRAEDRGDGAIIYIPPEFPARQLVDQLPGRLLAELRRHNANHSNQARIQLRVALNAGQIYENDNGVVSHAVNLACRVVDAPPAKLALERVGGMLALIATDSFYRDVIQHDPAAAPSLYREIDVSVKETRVSAWLRLPGHDGADLATPELPRRTWQRNDAFEMVNALLEMAALRDDANRQLLVSQLRPSIAGTVPYHAQPKLYLLSLVKTCEAHDGGLIELLEVVRAFEGDDSPAVRKLAEVIQRQC